MQLKTDAEKKNKFLIGVFYQSEIGCFPAKIRNSAAFPTVNQGRELPAKKFPPKICRQKNSRKKIPAKNLPPKNIRQKFAAKKIPARNVPPIIFCQNLEWNSEFLIFSLIIEGTSKKVLKFLMLLGPIYNKNFHFNEQKSLL